MTSAPVATDPIRSATPFQTPLDRAIQNHLGEHLRATYDGLSSLPLPRELASLLERISTADERVDPAFREGLIGALPNLRAFAFSLTRDGDHAADLVQDTIVRAWDKRSRFQPGTNLNAWLFTILRNSFYSEYRKRKFEVEDSSGDHAASLRTNPDQVDKLHVQDLQTALARLPSDQREALLLVGAEGLPYEDVAAICGCPVGTIKSRVNRARRRLAELMGYSDGDLAADNVMQAALTSSA
jgi:RNA polymerase sigma-70 factor (ECF subfamily)